MNNETGKKAAKGGGLAVAGFTVAILSIILAAASGLGNRLGAWDFRIDFVILRYAVFGAAIGALMSLSGLVSSIRRRGYAGLSAAGLIIGLITLYVPLHFWFIAKTVPPIHDISTDTDNPPKFATILPLRGQGPYANPSEYGGTAVAALQHEAYPDIRPLVLPVKSEAAFERALVVAKKLNWTIADADANEGRIEATDTTFWFGFKDDIAVRITSTGPESAKVDVRSVSRVGRSDLGKNAERIRKYLAGLKGTP